MAWSGGKDAAWALHTLQISSEYEVVGLFTTLTRGYNRVSMQGIRRDVLHAQAQATGLPLVESWIDVSCDNAAYIAAFSQSLVDAQARWPGLCHIAFGDLLLADVCAWREELCTSLGWQAVFPLFGSDTSTLARHMIDAGLQAHVCCVDTTQLPVHFAGHTFDHALLEALPACCDPCGERGEFHSCVHAGPMFRQPLNIALGETVLRDGRFAYTDVLLA